MIGAVVARDPEPIPFYCVDVNHLLVPLNSRLCWPIVRSLTFAHDFQPLRTQLPLAHRVAHYFVRIVDVRFFVGRCQRAEVFHLSATLSPLLALRT